MCHLLLKKCETMLTFYCLNNDNYFFRNMADYLPPKSLQVPLEVPSKLLMGPGPSNCPINILKASAQPMLGHLDGDFLKV